MTRLAWLCMAVLAISVGVDVALVAWLIGCALPSVIRQSLVR